MALRLPGRDDRYVVIGEAFIGGHNRQTLVTRLSDEQPIERVTMMERQIPDSETVLGGQAENAHAAPYDTLAEVTWDAELANRGLHTDLGERDDAEAQLGRLLDYCPRLRRHGPNTAQLPEHDLGVEKQLHKSSLSISSSSSSVNSKSSAIEIWPASAP